MKSPRRNAPPPPNLLWPALAIAVLAAALFLRRHLAAFAAAQ